MPTYPDVIERVKSTTPFQYSENFRMLSTEFENGQETRRLIDGYVRRTVKLNYGPVRWIQAHTLRKFYEEMKGPYTPFTFVFPQPETYTKELAGVISTSASSLLMRLPSRNAETYTFYKNGNPVTSGWSFIESPSVDTADKAQINFTVQKGEVYTWSFSGNLAIWARFVASPLFFSDTKQRYTYMSVELKSLYPEEV